MAETLSFISIAAFVAAGVCLVVTIAIFIRFKIPFVISDLSGRNARKSLEQMRGINDRSRNKSYRSGKGNDNRGLETEVLNENKVKNISKTETVLLVDEDATEVLQDDNVTVALDDYQEFANRRTGGISIEILEEIMLIHSNEVVR